MKVLFSGKQGMLYETALRAAGTGRREAVTREHPFRVEAVSPGPRLLELAQSGSYVAVIFVVESEPDSEPVHWLLQSSPALPVLAVLPGGNARLCKELQREGVSQVIEAGNLSEAALRRILHERLAALPSKSQKHPDPGLTITTDLHGIRSALTAIQGLAEFALTKAHGPSFPRKPLEGIVREVNEVEGLLRRIERKAKPHHLAPPK